LNSINIDIPGTTDTSGEKAGTSTTAGVGLYFLSSFYNHSCEPNVAVKFEKNNQIQLVTSK
jgi:hypothetical protein